MSKMRKQFNKDMRRLIIIGALIMLIGNIIITIALSIS